MHFALPLLARCTALVGALHCPCWHFALPLLVLCTALVGPRSRIRREAVGLREDLVQTANFTSAIKPDVWRQSRSAEEEEEERPVLWHVITELDEVTCTTPG